MKKRLLIAFFAVLLSLFTSPALAQAPTIPRSNQRVPGRILVKFKESTPQNIVDERLSELNVRISARINKLNVLVLNVPESQEDAIISAFSKIPNVEFAEPDFVATALTTTNDPSLSLQWGMFKIQAADNSTSAWDIVTGDSSVKIAILDTGIDQNHEDLAAKIVANQNFTTSPTADDKYGHGTHVGGIAAAITNNGTGVAGLGYNSSLMNVKVLDDNGSGYYF